MRLNILHVNYFINMFTNTQTTFTLSHVIYRLENQQDAYQMYQYLGFQSLASVLRWREVVALKKCVQAVLSDFILMYNNCTTVT